MRGRSLSGWINTAVVLCSFFLFSRRFSAPIALCLAALVATSPLLVVHGHYFKEDPYLTLGLVLSLLAFLNFLDSRSKLSIAMLGAATGIAVSSK